ncbi:hypothetical protein [Halolactibacillus sp. JCM 19043]|uniref:hypothetical protein n=1 Tax=Halolactibacillus sp. JCM 19043 TaxID=1460638 RepID=UPI00078623E8|nr:hypothetical protein [Halolactibacillus sp. JCM 19043]
MKIVIAWFAYIGFFLLPIFVVILTSNCINIIDEITGVGINDRKRKWINISVTFIVMLFASMFALIVFS